MSYMVQTFPEKSVTFLRLRVGISTGLSRQENRIKYLREVSEGEGGGSELDIWARGLGVGRWSGVVHRKWNHKKQWRAILRALARNSWSEASLEYINRGYLIAPTGRYIKVLTYRKRSPIHYARMLWFTNTKTLQDTGLDLLRYRYVSIITFYLSEDFAGQSRFNLKNIAYNL